MVHLSIGKVLDYGNTNNGGKMEKKWRNEVFRRLRHSRWSLYLPFHVFILLLMHFFWKRHSRGENALITIINRQGKGAGKLIRVAKRGPFMGLFHSSFFFILQSITKVNGKSWTILKETKHREGRNKCNLKN